MSRIPGVAVSLNANPGAVPESHFYNSGRYGNGFIFFDATSNDAPALYLPRKAPDAIAYLDALIRAACDLRNEYVEWAKSHDVALAA